MDRFRTPTSSTMDSLSDNREMGEKLMDAIAGVEFDHYQGCKVKAEAFSGLFKENVVCGFESSLADGFLYCGNDLNFAGMPWACRYELAVHSAQDWIPFCIKNVSLINGSDIDLGKIPLDDLKVEMAEFVIVAYTDAPDVFTLIPKPYLHTFIKGCPEMMSITSRDGYVTNSIRRASMVDFCGQPFSFPKHMLPLAFQNVRKAAIDQVPYVNPHWEIEVQAWSPNLHRLTPQVGYEVPTTSEGPSAAFRAFWLLQKAVKQFPKLGYSVDFILVAPYVGNAMLARSSSMNGSSALHYDVMIKLARVKEHGTSEEFITSASSSNWFLRCRSWHYLIITSDDSRYGYCIPRNEVHSVWSHKVTEHPGDNLLVEKGDIASFRFDMQHDGWFSQVHRIIEAYPQDDRQYYEDVAFQQTMSPDELVRKFRSMNLKGNLFSGTHLGNGSSSGAGDVEPENEEQGDTEVEDSEDAGDWEDIQVQFPTDKKGKQPRFLSPPQNDNGGLLINRLHPYWMFFNMNAQCAALSRGLILPLDNAHPAGTYIFIDWTWTPSERTRFFRTRKLPVCIGHELLPKETLAVRLRIDTVVDTDSITNLVMERSDIWSAKPRFIFLGCTVNNDDLDDDDYTVLLVPSKKFLKKPSAFIPSHDPAKKLVSIEHYMNYKTEWAPDYLVHFMDVIPYLIQFMDGDWDAPVSLGKATLRAANYVTTLGDLMKQQIDAPACWERE
ncbi:hypothetical protein SLS57_002623 [Botryosphaeria dothidea]